MKTESDLKQICMSFCVIFFLQVKQLFWARIKHENLER